MEIHRLEIGLLDGCLVGSTCIIHEATMPPNWIASWIIAFA